MTRTGLASGRSRPANLFLRRPRGVRGFSFVEALTAITLTALAGGAILLVIESTIHVSQDALEQTIAAGVVEQMLDEAVGKRYAAVGAGAYQFPLVANSYELAGQGRERYDDTDDYHGFAAQGLEDVWGQPLGRGDDAGGLRHANLQLPAAYFANWRQTFEVYYVSATDLVTRLPDGQTSNYRVVEAAAQRVEGGVWRDLARARRVTAYIPQGP